MYIYIYIHMKVFTLNNFVSFTTRTPKSERNLKDTVYSSAYIVVYIYIYSKFLHIYIYSCSHIYIHDRCQDGKPAEAKKIPQDP